MIWPGLLHLLFIMETYVLAGVDFRLDFTGTGILHNQRGRWDWFLRPGWTWES